MEAVIILLLLVLLAMVAPHWGVISVDGLDSPEWERRRHWRGFGHPGTGTRGMVRKERVMQSPSILILAEITHVERLRQAEQAHLVAQAQSVGPASRRWFFPFRRRPPAPRPVGPIGHPCANLSGVTRS